MPNGINEREQHAFAKLTLSLRVTGKRPDGYHEIDAEMVSLDLHDVLTFDDGSGFRVTGPRAAAVPAGDDNLVPKALNATGRHASVTLDKYLPSGGGLGGGSSDAAAVFRWAGVLDPSIACQVGADVPFCLRGGRAQVTGVGEKVEALPFVDATYTLFTPPFGVSTAEVYRCYDELEGFEGGRSSANALETAALRVEPRLEHFRRFILEHTGQVPTLAGSGSTWFISGLWPTPERDLGGTSWLGARTTPALELA